jgi:hypothetical protein
MIRPILIAAALAAASPANAFTTSNQMRVEAVGPVTFSVKRPGGQNGAIRLLVRGG